MKEKTASYLHVAGVIFGGILINLPIGLGYIYGNVSTYFDSFYFAKVGKEKYISESLWLTSSWLSFFTLSIVISGAISHIIGVRLTLLTGVIISNVSVYISYFTFHSDFWAFHFTFAILTGVGSGFCYTMVQVYATTWVKHKAGISSGAVSGALGGGSIFLNLAATLFINPRNLEPDINVGESKYFSQDEIINRVPYVFFVLGALTTGCHVIAFPLMKNHPDFAKLSKLRKSSKSYPQENSCINESDNKINDNLQYGANGYVYLSAKDVVQHEKSIPNITETCLNNGSIASREQSTGISVTTLQALRTKTFYLLGVALGFLTVGFVVESGYYKQFGILYISDDYFLANISVGVSVAVFVSRFLWGFALDKFYIKYVLIYLTSSHLVILVFWFFTPLVNDWFYLIWTVILQASQSGTWIIFAICSLKYFGSGHYITIYGMLMCFGIVMNYAAPPLAEVILTELGWFWLFFFVAIASLISLVATLFLPRLP